MTLTPADREFLIQELTAMLVAEYREQEKGRALSCDGDRDSAKRKDPTQWKIYLRPTTK